jgi:hypothetical protein
MELITILAGYMGLSSLARLEMPFPSITETLGLLHQVKALILDLDGTSIVSTSPPKGLTVLLGIVCLVEILYMFGFSNS